MTSIKKVRPGGRLFSFYKDIRLVAIFSSRINAMKGWLNLSHMYGSVYSVAMAQFTPSQWITYSEICIDRLFRQIAHADIPPPEV